VAVAQSEQSKEKAPTQGQGAGAPAASDQTAGKRMHKPVSLSTDASSGQTAPTVVKGGKTSNDDWTNGSAKNTDPKTGKGQSAVSAGDVNGDGVPDATAKNSGHATEKLTSATESSNGTQPRDAASGQATGKRQHDPVKITTEPDAKPIQK